MAIKSGPRVMRLRKLFAQILEPPARLITNEVGGANRSVVDPTNNPPATIEWE